MGWGKIRKKITKALSPKNIAAIGLSPFTAGLSLTALKDNSGRSIIGELTGANSAKKANQKNIQLQQETNEKSIELANTAHQREVADLKLAGLNPVLSAGGTGAVTPTLGTAQIENTMPGGYLAQAQTAGQVASLFSSAKQMNSQAKLNREQAGAVDSQIRLQNAQAQLAEDQDEFYQDTGYFPGATEGQSTDFGGFGFKGGHSQTTPIRNPKKNSGRSNWSENNEDIKNMKDNYDRTKKKEQERIKKLEQMGWKKSMTTHR